MNILDRIVEAAKIRVERDKQSGNNLPAATPRPPFIFEQALRGPDIAFICEIKKASPSKGIIAGDFPYLNIAEDYESAGAAAISVLTEEDFFLGSDRYLADIRNAVSVPLLRKDFTIDPFQIEQAAALGADAVLLICAILSPSRLTEYIKEADKYGLSALVETHDEDEVKTALQAGARIIGVNNRNLKTFEVDITLSTRLRKTVPEDIIIVAESGIQTAEDIATLRQNKIDAVLIGETLMRAPDKKAALGRLRGDVV